jgi:hypothetical protein
MARSSPTPRPTRTGRIPKIDGPAANRLTKWFEVADFSQPPTYAYDTVARNLSNVRAHWHQQFLISATSRTPDSAMRSASRCSFTRRVLSRAEPYAARFARHHLRQSYVRGGEQPGQQCAPGATGALTPILIQFKPAQSELPEMRMLQTRAAWVIGSQRIGPAVLMAAIGLWVPFPAVALVFYGQTGGSFAAAGCQDRPDAVVFRNRPGMESFADNVDGEWPAICRDRIRESDTIFRIAGKVI